MAQQRHVTTRQATAEDVSALVALWHRFMAEERQAVAEADPEAVAAGWTLRAHGQVERQQMIVAVQENATIGFLGFIDARDRDWIPGHVAYVVDIYVAPEARSTPAGRLLFEHLRRAAPDTCTELWTNTAVCNARMQVLLQRAGFLRMDGFGIPGLKEQIYFRKELRRA